jgi:hypothetical protein
MSTPRLVLAFGLLLVASTAAQAESPIAAAAVPALTGIGSALRKLELGLRETDYEPDHDRTRPTPLGFGDNSRVRPRTPSLAEYLNAPARYGKLLPQPIDDGGAGYRISF